MYMYMDETEQMENTRKIDEAAKMEETREIRAKTQEMKSTKHAHRKTGGRSMRRRYDKVCRK